MRYLLFWLNYLWYFLFYFLYSIAWYYLLLFFGALFLFLDFYLFLIGIFLFSWAFIDFIDFFRAFGSIASIHFFWFLWLFWWLWLLWFLDFLLLFWWYNLLRRFICGISLFFFFLIYSFHYLLDFVNNLLGLFISTFFGINNSNFILNQTTQIQLPIFLIDTRNTINVISTTEKVIDNFFCLWIYFNTSCIFHVSKCQESS